MLDISYWYAISIAGIVMALLIQCSYHFCVPFLSYPRFWVYRYVIYPLIIRRRRWTSMTVFEACVLMIYITANVVCMWVKAQDLAQRCARMASANMMLLFLGGRTSPLADSLGVSLPTYYLGHFWIGSVVFVQGLVHASIGISNQPWVWDFRAKSGVLIVAALGTIFLLSLCFLRGVCFEFFVKTHILIALTILGGLLRHIHTTNLIDVLFPSVAIVIWVVSTFYRVSRVYRHRGGYIAASMSFPTFASQNLHTVKLQVRIDRRLKVKPGQYLYLYFPKLRTRYRFQGHPFMIAWCTELEEDRGGKTINITELTFLVEPRRGLTARLAEELRLSTQSQGPVLFDGPYGQSLELEQYETVMLVAKGIGIAGLLPYAQHLADRSCHDHNIKRLLKIASTPNKDLLRKSLHKDATKKVDLFWELELNCQENWVSDQLRVLQDQDALRCSNLIYCYYPEKKTSIPPIKLDQGWKCIYPGDLELTLPAAIEQEAGKSRKNIILVCGSAEFTRSIRNKVCGIMSETNIIRFVEVEFRPNARETREMELESAELQFRNRKILQRKSLGRLARRLRSSSQFELVDYPEPALEAGIGARQRPLERAEDRGGRIIRPTEFL